MKFIFNCVDGDQYRIDFPHFENLTDIIDLIIKGKTQWIMDDTNGLVIQVDKIISIREVRDEKTNGGQND